MKRGNVETWKRGNVETWNGGNIPRHEFCPWSARRGDGYTFSTFALWFFVAVGSVGFEHHPLSPGIHCMGLNHHGFDIE